MPQAGGTNEPQQGDAIWGHPKTEPNTQVQVETPTSPQVWTSANPQVHPTNPYQRQQAQVQLPEVQGPPGPVFQAGSQAAPPMFQRAVDFKPETQSMAPNLGFDGRNGRPEASFEPQNGGQVPGQFAQPPFPQAGQHGQPNPQVPMSQVMYGNPGNHFAPTNQMQQQGQQQGNLYGQIQPFGQLPDPQLQFGDARNCVCGQPAVLLNVKKEGPNQGRGFFKCAKQHPDQPCSFFEWADEPPRTAQSMAPGAPAMPGSMPQLPPGPLCPCGQPSLTLTVKKDGPNQGRNFYKCAQNQCGYFQWADQEPDPQGPPCGCGVPSVRRIVQKEGPNRGRPFMVGDSKIVEGVTTPQQPITFQVLQYQFDCLFLGVVFLALDTVDVPLSRGLHQFVSTVPILAVHFSHFGVPLNQIARGLTLGLTRPP